MRVFPDTNVLASAFGTRGLCADVVRLILAEHELLTGEVVIEELRRVLTRKFRTPAEVVNEVENLLSSYHVEPKPRDLPELKLADRNDRLLVASALKANAEILITGDKEILELRDKPAELRIASPRQFWSITSKPGRKG